ncbi:uncharacterized protein BX664DRAFT_264866 [Halteromyces radiatus]|uniref:uncharacterized protein n=1 Tax=Halteromyces radiatus TaxID=101107 RepID=UPI00221FC278|nr:uncharacterized protein BX664DRAFT_264866 [Halteromyces radiatus]KAI8086285.1 hypothetical protein BX664DRAFT_264866 [Halteromyces radiatus]
MDTSNDSQVFSLVQGPDHEYDVYGHWIHLAKRYGDDCTKYHSVVKGDTCTKLANKYGISVGQFYELNTNVHRGKCDNLFIGYKYCVKPGNNDKDSLTVNKLISGDDKDKQESKTVSDKITQLKQRQLLKRQVAFTYYWTAHASDYNNSKSKKVNIKTCAGKTISTVSETFANALVMEGSGVISSSKVVNLGSCVCKNYACFMELDAKKESYGLSSYGTSLRPFITVAANDIRRDTKIYVPALDGWSLPGSNKKHNGCLIVDDKSWSFGGNHIDWFVNHMDYYKSLNQKHAVSKVDIYEGGNCQLLDY